MPLPKGMGISFSTLAFVTKYAGMVRLLYTPATWFRLSTEVKGNPDRASSENDALMFDGKGKYPHPTNRCGVFHSTGASGTVSTAGSGKSNARDGRAFAFE